MPVQKLVKDPSEFRNTRLQVSAVKESVQGLPESLKHSSSQRRPSKASTDVRDPALHDAVWNVACHGGADRKVSTLRLILGCLGGSVIAVKAGGSPCVS